MLIQYQEAEREWLDAEEGTPPVEEFPASTQTFRMHSDGEDGPCSDRDAPPPPPTATGGPSRD
eukprot:11216450-Lingulodinium_polyedra.AAC.1